LRENLEGKFNPSHIPTDPSRKLIPVNYKKIYLQTHGTTMGTNKSFLPSGRITNFKPKRSKTPPLTQFIEHGEVSDTETTFRRDTNVKKEERLAKHFILYIKIHFKVTETFLYTTYTHFSSCHPPGVKRASLNVKHLDSS